jgi:serine/threonine protein kinase/formylglycine-generating enzyme required for sulfatase activity
VKRRRWERLKELHWKALQRPRAERRAFLERECVDDDALVEEVMALIEGDPEQSDAFLRAPDPPADAPDPGEYALPRVLGDFELLEELGHGGMGVVYRARQISLEREVAVKVLLAQYGRVPTLVERFMREAQAIAKLSHPGIVPIYTVAKVDGEHLFAMELVEGHDLSRELALLRSDPQVARDAILPEARSPSYVATVAGLARDLARTVQHAHGNRVIHRDIKPSNVLVERGAAGGPPVTRLVDFGLARDESLGHLSRSGDLLGTPYYMSPEQIEARSSPVDERTDIYSLGVVLYELLTLERPFDGETSFEVLRHIASKTPITPSKRNARVPRDLETICLKAIAKRPEDRYPSMSALADDLERFLRHESIVAVRPPLHRRVRRHVVRHRGRYISAGAVVAVAIGATLGASSYAASQRIREDVRYLDAMLESGVASARHPDCLEAQRRAQSALAEGDLPGADRATATRVLADLDARARALKSTGRAATLRGTIAMGGGPVGVQSDAAFFSGLRQLGEAADLLPDDEELALWSRMDTYFPRVRIRPGPDLGPAIERGDVHVSIAEVGWDAIGEPRTVEDWQSGPVVIEPGVWRLRVEVRGVGIAELTRVFDERGAEYELAPVVRPTSEVSQGMIRIPAGPTIVGMPRYERYPWLDERTIELPAFYIDRTEVTNGQYDAFVRATGRAYPGDWRTDREDWESLPVVGVTWFDAQAYAEWAGKRLPTWTEWEKAARGPDGFRFPWGNDMPAMEDLLARTVVGRERRMTANVWDEYWVHVRPVGTAPGDRSPYGLLDTLGNVREWTESLYVTYYNGRPLPELSQRVVKGREWSSAADDYLSLLVPAERSVNSTDTGFRCARSADAP